MRKLLWAVSGPLLALLCAGIASAQIAPELTQSQSVLTLGDALNRALGSPALSAAENEVRGARGALRQAGLLPNPQLEALVEDTDRDTRTTTLQLNQLIELGGKREARVEVAERAVDIARTDRTVRRAELRSFVIDAFYANLVAQERDELARASLDIAARSADAARKRVKAGRVSPVEETRARIAEANVRLEAVQAASELALARQQLAATWGADKADFAQVQAPPDLPDVPALGDNLAQLESAPEVARARAGFDHRQAFVQLERARRVPDVSIAVGAKRDEEVGRTQAVLGFAVPLPLFDRNQGNIAEALARADQARDQYTLSQTRIRNALLQTHQRLTLARDEASVLSQQVLPDSERNYQAAVKGFDLGKFNFLDVLDAQRTLLQAKSQYLRALSQAYGARAELDRLLGVDFAAGRQE